MTSHSESRVVPYTADRMYRAVADVERYPEFLPWCTALRVRSRAQEGNKEIVLAEMVVGFRALRERYISRIVLDPKARTISVTQAEGVFRRLDTQWHFMPEGTEGKSCRVDFAIDFAFRNRLLGAVAGQAFAHVLTRMSMAFEERAKVLT